MEEFPDKPRDAALADLIIPALAVAFTVYFFDSVWDLAWEARATGMVVGTALLALIALLLVRILRRLATGEAALSFGHLAGSRPHARQRAGIVLLCTLFIGLVPWLGLTLGLFTLSSALMLVLGARNWRPILMTAGSVSAVAYLLFVAMLNTRVPRGPIEALLATLF